MIPDPLCRSKHRADPLARRCGSAKVSWFAYTLGRTSSYEGSEGFRQGMNPAFEGIAFQSEQIAQTPVPGALPLFASVLGLGGFFGYRRKRKAAMA